MTESAGKILDENELPPPGYTWEEFDGLVESKKTRHYVKRLFWTVFYVFLAGFGMGFSFYIGLNLDRFPAESWSAWVAAALIPVSAIVFASGLVHAIKHYSNRRLPRDHAIKRVLDEVEGSR